MMTPELKEVAPQPLGLIWIESTCPARSLKLEETLKATARIHYCGQQPPKEDAPSAVILCLDGEDVDSKLKHFQAQATNTPIFVFGLHADPRPARAALLAGARGFIHLGMQPAQIIRTLSGASEDQTIVSRELLGAFLAELQARTDLFLTPRQREILGMIAVAATPPGEIAMPRELLEAFLTEVAMA